MPVRKDFQIIGCRFQVSGFRFQVSGFRLLVFGRPVSATQSNDWYRGPTDLVQHFRLLGEFTSTQERRLACNWYGLAISLAYPCGEEGGDLLVKRMILPAVAALRWGGGGGVSQHTEVGHSFSMSRRHIYCIAIWEMPGFKQRKMRSIRAANLVTQIPQMVIIRVQKIFVRFFRKWITHTWHYKRCKI